MMVARKNNKASIPLLPLKLKPSIAIAIKVPKIVATTVEKAATIKLLFKASQIATSVIFAVPSVAPASKLRYQSKVKPCQTELKREELKE
jgi:hypothetical protein